MRRQNDSAHPEIRKVLNWRGEPPADHGCSAAEKQVDGTSLVQSAGAEGTWKLKLKRTSKWHDDFGPCPHRVVLQHMKQHPNMKGEAIPSGMAMDTHDF